MSHIGKERKEVDDLMLFLRWPSAHLVCHCDWRGRISKSHSCLCSEFKAKPETPLRDREGMGKGSREEEGGRGKGRERHKPRSWWLNDHNKELEYKTCSTASGQCSGHTQVKMSAAPKWWRWSTKSFLYPFLCTYPFYSLVGILFQFWLESASKPVFDKEAT